MEISEPIKVKWDINSKRVTVTLGDRAVSIPGTFETLDEARGAAEVYASRYLRSR